MKKVVIDEVPIDLFNLTYRLGFHLIKEFDNSILFRSGCSASGPCSYILIDKQNGNKLKEFDQLICIDTDIKWEKPHKYDFDFVVYLSPTSEHLIIYYIDNDKTLKIPFTENLTSIIPQRQFKEMTCTNSILSLTYELDEKENKTLRIDLYDKKKYSR